LADVCNEVGGNNTSCVPVGDIAGDIAGGVATSPVVPSGDVNNPSGEGPDVDPDGGPDVDPDGGPDVNPNGGPDVDPDGGPDVNPDGANVVAAANACAPVLSTNTSSGFTSSGAVQKCRRVLISIRTRFF